jgi:CHAD domain-containing protein
MTSPDRLLGEMQRELFVALSQALLGQHEAIHSLRVTGRRLRLALKLLVRDSESARLRRARQALNGIIHAASESRDLDVGLEILEVRLEETGPATAETRRLLRRLQEARRRRRRQTVKALFGAPVASLRRDLSVLCRHLVGKRADVRACLRRQALATYAKLDKSIVRLGSAYEPSVLHSQRRRIRQLRYLSELAQVLLGNDSGAGKPLRRMQDELGSMHDQHVLAGWLGRQAAPARRHAGPGLGRVARRLAKSSEATVLARHRAWLASDPVDRIGRAMAALLAALTVEVTGPNARHGGRSDQVPRMTSR